MRVTSASCLLALLAVPAWAGDREVTGIQALHRHGQTFVTWKDVAEGEAGAGIRYSLYRAEQPITAANLAQAEHCYRGIFNNSARLYGTAFNRKDRLDGSKGFSVIVEGGKPLPAWSGLAVHTVRKPAKAYYAVIATDEKLKPVSQVVPGKSATTEPIDEQPGPIQAIKLHDSKERKGPSIAQTSITGKKGLPLHLTLHGSQGQGGGAGEYGDYYLFFGTPDMGYRDGLAGVFSVEEHRLKSGNRLLLRVRDAVEHPNGRALETYWFGYLCVPQGARHAEPRVYPFTEKQLLWITSWVVERYGADPERVTVGGSSSGGVGSNNVGFRHPELFAAAYPSVGRVRQVPAIAFEGKFDRKAGALMADGKTSYYDHVDGPKFAATHHQDLPFLGWACGRNDGYATWQEHIDMVKAMTAAHHGFAFSWNNGGHSEGGRAMGLISKHYPAEKFARNRSYPAFGNSSLDHKMGNGDPKDGDLEGGINLGFDWKDVVDESNRWSVTLSNDLARADMTVDVTPRRCQKFRPRAGEAYRWTSSTGAAGTVAADAHGLVTVPRVVIKAGAATTLTVRAGDGEKAANPPLDILVIAPHPDDEALGCAGVMLQALEKKQRVGVVLVTNGDGFPSAAAVVSKKSAELLVPADFLKLAGIRQQHSVGALSKIGVRASDLMFLGYPDSGLKLMYEAKDGKPFLQKLTGKNATYGAVVGDYRSLTHGQPAPYVKEAVLADLAEIIKARTPKEIYVTNEVDTHPDHKATFWFVRDAARSAGYRGALHTFVVHGKSPDGVARRVALTEAQQVRKRALIEEYQTKLSPIHDNLADTFTRPEEVFWPIRIE